MAAVLGPGRFCLTRDSSKGQWSLEAPVSSRKLSGLQLPLSNPASFLLLSQPYQCPVAAVKNDDELGASKQQKFFLSGGRKSKVKGAVLPRRL